MTATVISRFGQEKRTQHSKFYEVDKEFTSAAKQLIENTRNIQPKILFCDISNGCKTVSTAQVDYFLHLIYDSHVQHNSISKTIIFDINLSLSKGFKSRFSRSSNVTFFNWVKLRDYDEFAIDLIANNRAVFTSESDRHCVSLIKALGPQIFNFEALKIFDVEKLANCLGSLEKLTTLLECSKNFQ